MSTFSVNNGQICTNNLLIKILAAEAFLVLFQAYLLAPLIPELSSSFHVPVSALGLLVAAYTIPYGLSTLIYGPLSDRIGRKPILLTLMGMQALSCLLIPLSTTVTQLFAARIFGGLATGGIVPVSVSLVGDIFPYDKRGKQIGLLFGAMAGGIAIGASMGIFMNPIVGWRNEFVIAGCVGTMVFLFGVFNHKLFPRFEKQPKENPLVTARNAITTLISDNGKRLYSYIFLNGVFHSGVFSWLGFYFKTRHDLSDQQTGLALLGYGVPGMLFGVLIGKLADHYGRQKIVPIGLVTGAVSSFVLAFNTPVWAAALAVSILSLGYDMTQPLFAGMITSISSEKTRGLAVALSACVLFVGYGTGSYLFQLVLSQGLASSFILFAALEFLLGIAAFRIFRHHR